MGCVCFITTCACFVKKRDLLVSHNRTVWSYAFWFPEGDLLVLVYLVVQIWRLDVSCHKAVNTITVIASISSLSTLLFLLFRCSGRTGAQWLSINTGGCWVLLVLFLFCGSVLSIWRYWPSHTRFESWLILGLQGLLIRSWEPDWFLQHPREDLIRDTWSI